MPTTDTVGVNLTQMVELQRAFEHKAAEVEQLIGDLSRLVGSAGAPGAVHWQGRLADQFRSEWDGIYVKNSASSPRPCATSLATSTRTAGARTSCSTASTPEHAMTSIARPSPGGTT